MKDKLSWMSDLKGTTVTLSKRNATNYSSQIAGKGTYRDLQVASKTIFILRSHDLEIYTSRKMSGERDESIFENPSRFTDISVKCADIFIFFI